MQLFWMKRRVCVLVTLVKNTLNPSPNPNLFINPCKLSSSKGGWTMRRGSLNASLLGLEIGLELGLGLELGSELGLGLELGTELEYGLVSNPNPYRANTSMYLPISATVF
jgi:hypothetical protein